MNFEKKLKLKGHTVITFCPGCMRPLLPEPSAVELGQAFACHDFDTMVNIVKPYAAGFAIFVPTNEEMAQLLDHRVVVYPCCSHCSKRREEPGFLDEIERNIALSRRLFSHRKVEV